MQPLFTPTSGSSSSNPQLANFVQLQYFNFALESVINPASSSSTNANKPFADAPLIVRRTDLNSLGLMKLLFQGVQVQIVVKEMWLDNTGAATGKPTNPPT